MIDLAQFLTVGGLATFLILLSQALKTYLPPTDVRYIPYATLGLGVACGELFAGTTGHLITSQDWLSYGVGGLIAGFTAIGGYEATLDKILTRTPLVKIMPGSLNGAIQVSSEAPAAGVINITPVDTATTGGNTPPVTIITPPDQPPRG